MYGLQNKDNDSIKKMFDCVNDLRKELDYKSAYFNADADASIYSYAQWALGQMSLCLNGERSACDIESCVFYLEIAGFQIIDELTPSPCANAWKEYRRYFIYVCRNAKASILPLCR